MPVPTIGSVGDIIAVAEVAIKLAKALKDNGGSAGEYRDIISGLSSIEKSLVELNAVCRSLDQTTTYARLGEAIQQEVRECQILLENCKKRIEKFDKGLKKGGSGNKAKDAWYKICWRISQKDFVMEFTQRLQTRVQAVNLLTTILQLVKTDISDEKFYTRLDEIGTKIAEAHYDTLLSSLKDEIGRNNRMIERQTHSLYWLTLPNVQKFGSDLFTKLRNIRSICQETLHEVKWISSQIQFSRPLPPWSERTALLDDVFRQTVPIPIDFVTSWDSFDTLLNNRFKDLPGANLIKQQDYILEDADSTQLLNRWLPWQAVFRPGRKVKMSMVLNKATSPGPACPSCAVEDRGPIDKQVECSSCGLQYRRATEIVDIPARPSSEDETEEILKTRDLVIFKPLDPAKATENNPLKRKLWDTNPEDNSVRKFRRVCLVSTENIRVTGGSLRPAARSKLSSRNDLVFANCVCGLDSRIDDSSDCIQCILCGTYQHLQCHGMQQAPNNQWRCLRCHFIIDGQRESNEGNHCPIMGCSFSTRHRKFIRGYETHLAHFLSHEDIEIACTFCTNTDHQKLPIFTHARVYRMHLALIHGADILDSSFTWAITSSPPEPKDSESPTDRFPAPCYLCEEKFASFTELADHVEVCAARTVISNAESRKMLEDNNLDLIDTSNWVRDHAAPPFNPAKVGTERKDTLLYWRVKPEDVLCPANLTPWACMAGCYGAPKGKTKSNDDWLLYLKWRGQHIAGPTSVFGKVR